MGGVWRGRVWIVFRNCITNCKSREEKDSLRGRVSFVFIWVFREKCRE